MKKEIEVWFKKFDTDHNGTLDMNEFKIFCQEKKFPNPEDFVSLFNI